MVVKSKPHISVREYIRWPPAQRYENTITLVVTSAGGLFVDIRARIYHPGVRAALPQGVIPSHGIEWAFGGTSTNELIRHRDGTATMHCIWHHLVDSRFLDADAVTDQGDMYPLPDGKSMEKGKMVNPLQPDQGEREYEEGWADVPIVSQRDDGALEVMALQLVDDEEQARGMVVRVGQVCQGVVRVGEDYACERWVWQKEGGWKREFRDGVVWMPTGVAMEVETLELGGSVKYDNLEWKVVELGVTE